MRIFKYLLIGLVFLSLSSALDVPKLVGRVNDQAKLLTIQEQQQLEDFLAGYERETSNQLAVLIIPSLDGESLEDYSMRVAEKWKLGVKGKDNGLLLLIALNDKKIRIEVGYGLEGPVTDVFTGEVIREIIAPAFRQGDYYQGIYDALFAVAKKVGGEFTPDKYSAPVYGVDHANVTSNINEGNLEGVFFSLLMFGILAGSMGKVTYRRGFWGSVFLPLIVFMFLGIPFSLPLLLLLLVFGFPFTFILIILVKIFGSGGGGRFSSGGFSSGGSSFGGFSGGGGGFGGGGSSGGW